MFDVFHPKYQGFELKSMMFPEKSAGWKLLGPFEYSVNTWKHHFELPKSPKNGPELGYIYISNPLISDLAVGLRFGSLRPTSQIHAYIAIEQIYQYIRTWFRQTCTSGFKDDHRDILIKSYTYKCILCSLSIYCIDIEYSSELTSQ